MKPKSIVTEMPSVSWQSRDTWGRTRVKEFIQQVLEEELTTFLGRQKSQRRGAAEAGSGYRNGHGTRGCLTLSGGTIKATERLGQWRTV
ncbi:hypothetical protein [Nitrospira sp. Nam74]